jgi:hypothetical protein
MVMLRVEMYDCWGDCSRCDGSGFTREDDVEWFEGLNGPLSPCIACNGTTAEMNWDSVYAIASSATDISGLPSAP